MSSLPEPYNGHWQARIMSAGLAQQISFFHVEVYSANKLPQCGHSHGRGCGAVGTGSLNKSVLQGTMALTVAANCIFICLTTCYPEDTADVYLASFCVGTLFEFSAQGGLAAAGTSPPLQLLLPSCRRSSAVEQLKFHR